MTTQNNKTRDALDRGLTIYRDTMRRFIVQSLERSNPNRPVENVIAESMPSSNDYYRLLRQRGNNVEESIDIGNFLPMVSKHWDDVFSKRINDRYAFLNRHGLVNEIRRSWAHGIVIDHETARSRLTDIAEILGIVNATDQKRAVEEIRDSLTVQPIAPKTRPAPATTTTVQVAAPPKETIAQLKPAKKPRANSSNLAPWRNVIQPHADVAEGNFSESEFAADLIQVQNGKATPEYGNPKEFFKRTYITPGIHSLLVNAIKRINAKGGDPVIQTKTGFGGGKTHSLIALFHLAKSINQLTENQEILELFKEADVDTETTDKAKVAVISGTYHSPTDSQKTPNGAPLNTLWGQIAYQLGSQEAYDIIAEAARTRTAPAGAQLDQLFQHTGPAVILIDELVAYVRNVPRENVGSIYTFLQALTESAGRSKNVTVVVTLPESEAEAGGDAGMEALNRLDQLFGRTESIWHPLEVNEAYEVIRRRLFTDSIDEQERDRTCQAFSNMYGGNLKKQFPAEASETRYLQRIKNCYPIHPEIFNRLYTDWSTIHKFQRTRGVLRIMANTISRLYLQRDSSPLIIPASLPLDDPALSAEFTKVLDGRWEPVITEIDGTDSRTDTIDRTQKRFADVGGAARRAARAVFLASAPTRAIRGIGRREVMLASVEPKQSAATYRDALELMHGQLYYLYRAGDHRYYFHTEENLNKVAADRADQISNEHTDHYIIDQLHEAARDSRTSDVIVCPESSQKIPESDNVRLVILPPSSYLQSRQADANYAHDQALNILLNRGDAKRTKLNTIIFLAARYDDVNNLRRAATTYLAWDSILNGDRKLTLEGARKREAERNLRAAGDQVVSQLPNAYKWALAPAQDDSSDGKYKFSTLQTDAPNTGDIVQSALAKCIAEEVLVDRIAPSALTNILDRYIWSNENYNDYHIGVDILWNIIASYIYMPRLRNRSVLNACIAEGVQSGAFGHATGYSEGTENSADRYHNLAYRETLNRLAESPGFLVHHEIAQVQQSEDSKNESEEYYVEQERREPIPSSSTDTLSTAPPPGPRRITASKSIGDSISLDDISQLQSEIIRTLHDGGGEVTVKIIIEAQNAHGFSQNITRSIRENGIQLNLDIQTSDD